MKVIAKKVWEEPAVFIGLLVTIALVFVNVLGDDDWGIDNILAVIAPLLTALGIRPLVMPTAKLDELTAPPEGTTFKSVK